MEVRVNVKQIGKKRNGVREVRYEIPGCPGTVEELIRGVTAACVGDYNRRKESAELIRCLTKEQIEESAQAGKIGFGVNYGEKEADVQQAEENALQSFEDGIYRIFLNDRPLERLDEGIRITDEDSLTFVRLTMLAGRMW